MADAIEYIKGRIAECQNPDYMVPVHMQALDEVLARVAELEGRVDELLASHGYGTWESYKQWADSGPEPLQGEQDE